LSDNLTPGERLFNAYERLKAISDSGDVGQNIDDALDDLYSAINKSLGELLPWPAAVTVSLHGYNGLVVCRSSVKNGVVTKEYLSHDGGWCLANDSDNPPYCARLKFDLL
jgi:hypothetical protein